MSDTNSMTEVNRGNPFVYNVPVRGNDFFNRTELMNKLIHETVTGKSQGNVWITGERQIGKTSLLRYIQTKYEAKDIEIVLYPTDQIYKAAFIFLNVQDITSRDDFFQIMGQSLKNYFDFKIKLREAPYDRFIDMMTELHTVTKNYIVFLIDEFDAFIEHMVADDPLKATTFLAEFNKLSSGISMIKLEPKVFGCIIAANSSIEDLFKDNHIDPRGSGLVLETVELEWFTREQVADMARHYLKGNAIHFSPEDINMCYKMTLGYPYFVQKIFAILYDHKSRIPFAQVSLQKVQEEYGAEFLKTVKKWSNERMPNRTRIQLQVLGKALEKYLPYIFTAFKELL